MEVNWIEKRGTWKWSGYLISGTYDLKRENETGSMGWFATLDEAKTAAIENFRKKNPGVIFREDASQKAEYSNVTITHEMSTDEILKHLGSHGCKVVTEQLNLSRSSEYTDSSGGFGDVYRGAMNDGSRVAIKCIRLHMERTDGARKHLKDAARELYVWSKCRHPNVLGLIGVAEYRNQIAMVSPWMEYGSVNKFIETETFVQRYKLCAQISEGVSYLHRPELTDFGSARLREYTLEFSKTTSLAKVSLNWAAPEMLDDEAKATNTADVFSLGMTIYEVITGSKPYDGQREFAVLQHVMKNEPPPRPEEHVSLPTEYNSRLWRLLMWCWTSDPQRRPTASQVKDEMKLIQLMAGESEG